MTDPVWQPLGHGASTNPYVHWWQEKIKPRFPPHTFAEFAGHMGPQSWDLFKSMRFDFSAFGVDRAESLSLRELQQSDLLPDNNGLSAALKAVAAGFDDTISLPNGTVNSTFGPDLSHADWVADIAGQKDAYRPPNDAVVVGVIDAAIALGHQRFTHPDGKTRFLAAWQQSALTTGQAHLPFGRELLKEEIDTLIETHTHGGILDEDGFQTDAGLADMLNPMGQREIAQTVAHGSHVLDLATGYDPTQTPAALLEQRPIIAVNLPNRFAIGASGSFLEQYVILAVARIVDVADAIWARGFDDDDPARSKGYPIVINLSYGLNAGPKDGTTLFESYLRALIAQRDEQGKAPLRIVLPAGNDNLERGNAIWKVVDRKTFKWRIMPEDQTSNYLEVWTDYLSGTEHPPPEISVVAPNGETIAFTRGTDNHFVDIGDYARIYCQYVFSAPISGAKSGFRLRYVICTAPTLSDKPGAPEAPSGIWRVKVAFDKNYPQNARDVFVHVQSDQSVRTGGATGLLSYLDHRKYRVFDERGFYQDTYEFSRAGKSPQQANLERNNDFGPVQRKGTLNALASSEAAIVVAGHRLSDQRPAPYSSTGRWGRLAADRPAPTLSYPSDEGPAHPGILAAGSRSGSVVAMQGTSFATAQATRDIADALAGWRGHGSPPGSEADMIARATDADAKLPNRKTIYRWKSGAGRMPGTPQQRKPRIDTD